MIIKVRIDNVEISVEENHRNEDKHVTLRWSDQNKMVQETIKVMSEQCIKLREVSGKDLYNVTGGEPTTNVILGEY